MKNPPLLRDANAPEPASTASFLWSDARVLGYTPMDETHEEFYQVAFALLTSTEATMLSALDAFERHAVDHFEQEDGWMRSTEFPPRDCHIEEHEAVLKSTREVRQLVASGERGLELVHDFALHLFQWFPGHADYLDSALAAWMTKRTMGGKPVVLRRSIAKP
ncbi:hemerythrin domain-containing protein [Aquabacterium sp. J223]|uniref:hemerythrin domain-containing protein n=1 Tax=Aquabacterium sp. J223 TaxID=2898431 RepID=UPI0021ADC356|nr:hemerythrin domain-containing protein [Aquabacterium sp. J223]UUX96119.1 hemerythrin [Aquabacterium sp. J223]